MAARSGVELDGDDAAGCLGDDGRSLPVRGARFENVALSREGA